MGYLDRALKEKPAREKLVIHWNTSTTVAVGDWCVHHRGWNRSSFSEVAVLEKLEREKIMEQEKKPELLMPHGSKEARG